MVAITSNIIVKDYTVEFDNSDMKQGTIPKKSCVRADKIYTLDKNIILKNIGAVSDDILNQVKNLVCEMIEKSDK